MTSLQPKGASIRSDPKELHAVIGVRFANNRTYYVRRSAKMTNFPSVWSLLSIQYDPRWLKDANDLAKVQTLMERMSKERLGGAPIKVKRFLTSGDDPDSPVGRHVHLHLYEIELPEEPQLNPDYYTDAAWLTPEKYEQVSADESCGLCLRLWSDFSWLAGFSDRPFISRKAANHV